MDSIALQRRPSRPVPTPAQLRQGFAAILAAILAIILWPRLVSAPHRDTVVQRDASAIPAGSALVGDLARWRAADGGERLLVASGERDAVVVYDAQTGQPLAATAPGRFAGISGLAVEGGRLYVAEHAAGRVQMLGLPGLRTMAVLPLDAAPARGSVAGGVATTH